MLSRVVERINAFLMQVEGFFLVFKVDVVDVDQAVETGGDNVLQVRVVLDFRDPGVVHQDLTLLIALFEYVVGLVLLCFDLSCGHLRIS